MALKPEANSYGGIFDLCVEAIQKAEQRANKAEQRAERFAEQLQALGINPDDILIK